MHLSEFYGMTGGRIEFSQPKPTSTAGLSRLPNNNELAELVWENGQITMQGQSSRARRDNNSNNIQSQISKFGERDLGNASNPKAGNGLMGTILDDFTETVPSDMGLDRDDDMAPWLNYHDQLHNNYGSDLLPELSSVTINDLHKKNIFRPIFERNQPIAPSLRSGVSNAITNSIDYVQASSSAFSNTSSGIMNFSHFSRPVALARANTRSVEKTGVVNKVNFVPIGNEKGSAIGPNMMLKMVNTRNIENPENVLHEDGVRNEAPPQQVEGAIVSKGTREGEKAVEPVVASSSVCSGNNPEQGLDDQTRNLKRKGRETDDSEGRSEDVEEESVGIRKTAPPRGGTGAKRSRAAEVHNLSERRRRDRINEKMRALQELIPNCNKVDKASMLDEAIEYLKTLQLQVQMMSMGAGLYMPHMMLPGHMGHFQPMMGVGMGFGMGLNHFHGPRAMPFSGPANFQMMPGPNFPVYGPGIPVSALHQPSVPISAPLSSQVANGQSLHHVSLAKEANGVLHS